MMNDKIMIVLLTLVLLAAPAAAQETAEEWFETGKEYYSQERYHAAVDAFTQAIDRDIVNPQYYNWRGYTYYLLGDNHEALDDFNRAVALKEDSVNMYHNRGLAHYHLGNYREAVSDFSKAIGLDAGYRKGTLFYWRARARVFIARDIQTVEDYTKALEYGYEDRYGVYILRGKANDALGRRREALRDLTAAVNIEPEQTRAYGERGALLYVLKRYVPAERDLSRALELDPSESGALVYLGLIDLVMGRYDRAEERFGKAMSSERDRVIAHHNLAAVYLLTRRPGKANDLLREVWRDFDTQTNNYVYAAVLRYFCLLNQEKEGAGRAFLEEVYDSAAPNIRAYPLLRYLNGDWSADELIGSFGDDRQGQTMAHAVIGLENLYAGRKSEAVEHLRRSVHEGAAAPFSTQALLEYRNLAAEDPGLKDVVPASVYFEPDPVRQGHWGRLVAEYIPFPGEVTVKETWTIHSPGLTSPPLDKAYTITHEDHRHVSDFRIPEKIEPGLYELRMKVTFDGEERKIAGEFKIR